MLYALESNDRFIASNRISAYRPEVQRTFTNLRTALSVKPLQDELLGIRFADGLHAISVPYLKSLVHFAAPEAPQLEAATAFAQTPQALAVAREVIQNFEELKAAFVDESESNEGLISLGEAAGLFNFTREKIEKQLSLKGLSFIEIAHSPERNYTIQHITATTLNSLYEWYCPASFP